VLCIAAGSFAVVRVVHLGAVGAGCQIAVRCIAR
jgi:hypothetical protein